MAIVYELIVKQDLDLGVGQVVRTNPGGGQMLGDQVSLATFATEVSQAWAPGLVGATSASSIAVTVPGAVVGMPVLVALSTLSSGTVLLWGYVQSAGSVRVILYNFDAAPTTIPSGTLRVLVFIVP